MSQFSLNLTKQGSYNIRSCSTASGALSGVKVLDLTRVLAGPFCTMNLGDLGADILKVEKPGTGDDTRGWGPPFVGSQSCYFLSVNRNKRSICIDMKSDRGQEIIRQLAVQSDVLVENYLPDKLNSCGLGYGDLKEANPRLVYCSITGYGSSGPYASRPGYDVIAASIGGLSHVTGPEDGDPCKTGVALTDLTAGLYAQGSILAALFQRERTGRGQLINVNLLSSQISCLVNLGANYLMAHQEAKRWGTAHESIVPYQSFRTNNGYMTVGGANNRQFRKLCQKMDRLDLADDPEYATNADRVRNRRSLLAAMSETMATKSNEGWIETFAAGGADFPYGPINSLSQVFKDDQVVHSRIVKEVEHPTAGVLKLVGPPVDFSGSDSRVRLPPPLLGQHTDDVLKDRLGYSAVQIQQLRHSGIIY